MKFEDVRFGTLGVEDDLNDSEGANGQGDLSYGENDAINFMAGDGHPVLRAQRGGRIFIDSEETTDVERIGAAFAAWAKVVLPKKK